MEINKKKLIEEAWKARENSHSPYSKFKVGAAVLGIDGEIYHGANIENISYGATVCAERTAIFNMINNGCKKFVALAYVTNMDEVGAPCCICRQVMLEFCFSLDVQVFGSGPSDIIHSHSLRELAPVPFMAFEQDN